MALLIKILFLLIAVENSIAANSKPFGKMKVKELKQFLQDRGLECTSTDGHKCQYKSEYIEFAKRMEDEPIQEKVGLMEQKKRDALSQLKQFGWENDPSGKGEVHHMINDEFESFRQGLDEGVAIMVLLYTTWCGGCTAVKPYYTIASVEAKEEQLNCVFVAIDCDANPVTCKEFSPGRFPTYNYYPKRNTPYEAYTGDRGNNGIIQFLKRQESTEEWTNEPLWEENGNVVHLTDEHFPVYLFENRQFFALFYATWCGHCKALKPAFVEASEKTSTIFVAVDCGEHTNTCNKYNVEGFPTLMYFDGADTQIEFDKERSAVGFLTFIETQQNVIEQEFNEHQEL